MRRTLTNLFIIGFLAAQLILMATCYARDAKFFGWQMFSYGLIYRIRVDVAGADGVKRPLDTAVYDRSLGKIAANWFRYTEGFRTFGRGNAFFLAQAARLPAFLCGKLRGDGARLIEVAIEYRDATETSMTRQVFTGVCDE